VKIGRADELGVRRGLSSEIDERCSFVARKMHSRWLWHAIDPGTDTVGADGFGRRKDAVFLQLKAWLEPFGMTRYEQMEETPPNGIWRLSATGLARTIPRRSKASTSLTDTDQALGTPYKLLLQNRTHARSGDRAFDQPLRIGSVPLMPMQQI
jgi:hypothetical protein